MRRSIAFKIKVPIILIILYLSGFGNSFPAQAQSAKFEALFIYKFIENMKFPQGNDKLCVGVYGKDALHVELTKMLSIKNSTIKTISIKGDADLQKCDIIYLAKEKNESIEQVKNSLKESGSLIISESKEHSTQGAGIAFNMVEGKLKFIINKAEIEKKGVLISAGLQSLATVI